MTVIVTKQKVQQTIVVVHNNTNLFYQNWSKNNNVKCYSISFYYYCFVFFYCKMLFIYVMTKLEYSVT